MCEMKIGDLARRTGLTVRTLHHYDQIGLLSPSRRSAAGYRLYGEKDLARLLEILLLRRIGLSLAEIGDTLGNAEHRLGDTLRTHIEHLRARIEDEQRLLRRLETVAQRLGKTGRLSVGDMTTTLETLTMYEKYYSPEQLATLAERAETLGAERIAEGEAEWPRLITLARAALERGADPTDPEVQKIAERWRALIEAFTGGDPGIERSLGNLYRGEPEMRKKANFDPALSEYMGKAMAALGE